MPRLRVIAGTAVSGEMVREIRDLSRAGTTPDALARRFHLRRAVIDQILPRTVDPLTYRQPAGRSAGPAAQAEAAAGTESLDFQAAESAIGDLTSTMCRGRGGT